MRISLAVEKLGKISPNHHMPREKYDAIGRELAHSERGRFICGNYLARTRNYYRDIYYGGDSFPE